jgi:hypothetical protein
MIGMSLFRMRARESTRRQKVKIKNKKGTTSATYKAQVDQIFFIKL